MHDTIMLARVCTLDACYYTVVLKYKVDCILYELTLYANVPVSPTLPSPKQLTSWLPDKGEENL